MRPAVRRQQVGVALFPFLAVLICTMGSLIVLLVLLVQQARLDARAIVALQTVSTISPADEKQRREALEDAQWRRELLEQSRTEKTAELADSRSKLAHLEDHLLKLAERARELLARAQQIDKGEQLKSDDVEQARLELARLKTEIDARQAELEAKRRDLKHQEQWFALIPYVGPSGTRRRPIYVECTAAGVILQPEGIVFTPDDFDGPLGPHNPLDAALRTVREHLSQTLGKSAGEPYPLLVVRPSGVMAYGAARSALKAWDDEFGYELVGDEKQLDFGSPDPALAGALQNSVAIARQRQIAMAAMMPRRYQRDEPLQSFAASDSSSASSGGAGRGFGGASGPGGSRGSPSGLSHRTGSAGGFGPGSGVQGTSDLASASTPTGGQPAAPGNPSAAGGAPGPYSPTNAKPTAGGKPMAGGVVSNRPNDSVAPVEGDPTAPDSQLAAGAPSANMQFGSSQSTGQQEGKPGSKPGAPTGGQRAMGSLAAERGRNWALPGAARHATAITRPIRVAVLADRLVLVPEQGDDRQPLHLRVTDPMTAAEIDAFVAAVQREMKGWGLAVENGYWKPIIETEVAPDAESHFAELQSALDGSGFELGRKLR